MFTRATKSQSRLRLGLCGTSGGGKTYTALALATGLSGNGRVAVVDTEHGSAAKYSDLFPFDVVNLATFEPSQFIAAIKAAEQSGYDVIILDSLSHAWMGTGGTLDQVEEAKRRNSNSFTAWREPSRGHTELIEAILHARIHVIATMRSKTEYVMEPGPNGKTAPRKVGLAPVQRDGMEYEFDIVGDMNEGTFVVIKSRCPTLTGKSFHYPGSDLADVIKTWLTDGVPVPAAPEPAKPAPPMDDADARFASACVACSLAAKDEAKALQAAHGAKTWKAVMDSQKIARAKELELQAFEQACALNMLDPADQITDLLNAYNASAFDDLPPDAIHLAIETLNELEKED